VSGRKDSVRNGREAREHRKGDKFIFLFDKADKEGQRPFKKKFARNGQITECLRLNIQRLCPSQALETLSGHSGQNERK